MKHLPNDVLMKIITTISEDKNKEIYDLQNKVTKLKDDLDKAYMLKYKYDSLGREISQSYWSSENKKMNRVVFFIN